MGKSTAMKHLSLCWANGSVEALKQFDFIFHLALKAVKGNENIENIIKEQHAALCGNKVQLEEIRAIIEGETKHKVLLLLDGHDEYKPGTNTHIDKAITGIFSEITKRCPDWDEIRKTGERTMKDLQNVMVKLGKLALNGLQREHFQTELLEGRRHFVEKRDFFMEPNCVGKHNCPLL